MQTNEATIFVFIASLIIGILISMNIDLGKTNRFLDIKQYEQAYNERSNLQKDISNLQSQLNHLYGKISRYEENSQNASLILNQIDQELDENKMILGETVLEGEGIKIVLNDAPEASFGKNYNSSMLIHDADIVKVINELRNAGAEAIAINGYRIVYNTFGFCAGSNVNINGIKIVAPFTITAIGNTNVMENYLTTQENHLKELKRRGCYVEIEPLSNVVIPAYNGELQCQYLQESVGK